jgi:hypothetical protein
MPIARRDDGAIPIDAVECPSPEAAVERARQMSRLPYYICEEAFTRSGWQP